MEQSCLLLLRLSEFSFYFSFPDEGKQECIPSQLRANDFLVFVSLLVFETQDGKVR